MRDPAYKLLTGGLSEAFDLGREDPRLVARYDTAPLVRPDAISKSWKNYNHYVDNAKTLGKLLLLARRLCERGAGFVTVTTSFVWDMHADENNAPMEEGMRYMGVPLDYALSALVEDIHARGPRTRSWWLPAQMGVHHGSTQRGRDHWGNLGRGLHGGMPMGRVTKPVKPRRLGPAVGADHGPEPGVLFCTPSSTSALRLVPSSLVSSARSPPELGADFERVIRARQDLTFTLPHVVRRSRGRRSR